MQLVKPGLNLDFIGKRRGAAVLSIVVVGISVFLAVWGTLNPDFPMGPRYGVDFAGGTLIQLNVADDIDISGLRRALAGVGMNDDSVQSFGTSGHEYLVRVETVNFGADSFFDSAAAALKSSLGEEAWKSFDWTREQSVSMRAVGVDPIDIALVAAELQKLDAGVTVVESKVEHNAFEITYPGITDRVKEVLGVTLGENNFEVARVEMVGPTVGAELRRKGLMAMFFSLALILVYVAFRFDLSFAPGAVAALGHDVAITIGVFCVLGREFSLPTIGALLTIIGYSLNDTIVVYDRIRENLHRYPRRDLSEVINLSLNETLSRTLLTSITTMLAVISLIVLGGPILQDFAIALAVGVVVGTYSSIYVASPMILALQKWLPVDVRETSSETSAGRARA
jgi:preprotein translocase subunit SecF